MSITVNGTTGLNFPDGTSQPTAGLTGFRNVLYNGAFEVAQRGTTFDDGAGFHNQYGLDRWAQGQFQAGPQTRVSVSSPVSGMSARYACRISSSSTAQVELGTRMALGQKVESVNSIPLRGKQVSFSFWIRFSASTISSVSNTGNSAYQNFFASIWYNSSTTDAVFASTGSDTYAHIPAGDLSTPTFVNGSLPTIWTKVTGTVTVPNNINNIGVRFNFGALGSTSTAGSAWYEVTEVQLEQGGGSTAFEWRPIGTELALCQRYFQLLTHVPAIGGTTTSVRAFSMLPTRMRVSPTVGATGPLNYQGDGVQNTTQSSVSFSDNGSQPYALSITANNFSNITNGRTLMLSVPANNGYVITLSSEL
jgi:hypothetical protein